MLGELKDTYCSINFFIIEDEGLRPHPLVQGFDALFGISGISSAGPVKAALKPRENDGIADEHIFVHVAAAAAQGANRGERQGKDFPIMATDGDFKHVIVPPSFDVYIITC